MASVKTCRICGVPLRFGRDHNWNPDGTITQRRDPDHRMVFLDSDGIDSIFRDIEELIGVSIEKIIIESKARATQNYINRLIRGPKGFLVRLVGLGRIISKVVEQGMILGYGKIKVLEFNWKENYMYCEITRPYSLPLFCGDLKGANQAIRKVAGTVSYEEVSPDKYLIKNYNEPHAPGLEERLVAVPPPRKPGDISYERCPGCGAPRDITRFRWDLDSGIITEAPTGLRYALFGPVGLQVIFDELQSELGDEIPSMILDAQKKYVGSQMGERWKGTGMEDYRNWLSIQGLGNLVSLDELEDGFAARVQNAALPQLTVGAAAALYEYLTGGGADTDWEYREDGDLDFTIRRKP